MGEKNWIALRNFAGCEFSQVAKFRNIYIYIYIYIYISFLKKNIFKDNFFLIIYIYEISQVAKIRSHTKFRSPVKFHRLRNFWIFALQKQSKNLQK